VRLASAGAVACVAAAAIALAVPALGPASDAARLPGFVGCRAYTAASPKPIVRPRSIIAACADANLYFTGLRWSTWTATHATATGTAHVNDCTPSCAAGRFHTYPAHVMLSGPRSCAGKRELTALRYRFPAKYGSGTQTFRCR